MAIFSLCCIPKSSPSKRGAGTRKKEYHNMRRRGPSNSHPGYISYELPLTAAQGQPISQGRPISQGQHRSQGRQIGSHPLYPGARYQYDARLYQAPRQTNGYSTAEDYRQDGITSYSEESDYSSCTDSYLTPYRNQRQKPYASRRLERMRGYVASTTQSDDASLSGASSYSSYSDDNTSLSMNIITVTLNLEQVSFLGMSIVGQCYSNGDRGIFIGAILKGGAVDRDGRIKPGDMILAVNERNIENLSNEAAVELLRKAVQLSKTVTLVVAKCWDDDEDGPTRNRDPRLTDPVRPIDPSMWIAHTNAMRRRNSMRSRSSRRHHGSLATISSLTSSSLSSSLVESDCDSRKQMHRGGLTVDTPPGVLISHLVRPESGLELREQEWLKMKFSASFIGSELLDWLLSNVRGFADRRDVKKYVTVLLRAGYIKSALNDKKRSFSEEGYYTVGKLSDSMSSMNLSDSSTTDLEPTTTNKRPQSHPAKDAEPFQTAQTTVSTMPQPTPRQCKRDQKGLVRQVPVEIHNAIPSNLTNKKVAYACSSLNNRREQNFGTEMNQAVKSHQDDRLHTGNYQNYNQVTCNTMPSAKTRNNRDPNPAFALACSSSSSGVSSQQPRSQLPRNFKSQGQLCPKPESVDGVPVPQMRHLFSQGTLQSGKRTRQSDV